MEYCKGETTLVRFAADIHECPTSELTLLCSAEQAYKEGKVASTGSVILKLQATTIRAINDTWGVFSPSRIDLYPHQLWVCRKVTEQWPVRWVVADDVGLGKTIEAGLILWRLFNLGLIRRLLILCPASLVKRWQEKLFEMFDIRVVEYVPSQDTDRLDYWNMNNTVVASFHTLREDRKGRHDRIIQAEPWDLVIVDEAHHLNFDENTGMTLAHRLLKNLQDAERLISILLFTGTPHRGKHFGFLALMSLVRPDLFDPRKPVESQLSQLPKALIRNNKYHVTNLQGQRMFQPPQISATPYRYSEEEDRFYRMMTDFIASGRAYATDLDGDKGRAVMLVLVALQKLASSSVEAVRSALRKRLNKLRDISQRMHQGKALREAGSKIAEEADDADSQNRLIEDQIVVLALELMENECVRLEELISAADAVVAETKIVAIIRALGALPSGESVLLFTEYKATQSLILSALMTEFGSDCATFINGDEALPDVLFPNGERRAMRESRGNAEDRFNSGKVRFLVSTEAAGEGIDLHHRCSRLIHVDLPWNPMRLHQRVGRLSRIGQQETIKVMLFQNPDTLESRIWNLLNEKLERIRMSINEVTEHPEDVHQLVLGVARPSLFDDVFAKSSSVSKDRLSEWFDTQTGQMGGDDAVKVVKSLIGHAQHFDFGKISKFVPKCDLPDLVPFFRLSLRFNHRQIADEEGAISFKTPDAWTKVSGIRHRYEGLQFERKLPSSKRTMMMGVGNRLFDTALEQAVQLNGSYALTGDGILSGPLFVFRCYDRITGNVAQPKAIIVGVAISKDGLAFLQDWQVLSVLNSVAVQLKTVSINDEPDVGSLPGDAEFLAKALKLAREGLSELEIPYNHPELELIGSIGSL